MATDISLSTIKFIDQSFKNIVFGFIRQCQQLLPDSSSNVYYRIPTLVHYLCLLYYHQQESFEPDWCHECIQLTQENTVATWSRGGEKVVMLRNIVESGCHRWKFKLLQYSGVYMTVIGVVKVPLTQRRSLSAQLCFQQHKRTAYGFELLSAETIDGDEEDSRKYGTKGKQGDVIEMILDLNKRELRYAINGESQGVAYTNIAQTKYRAAISGFSSSVCYQLLSYMPSAA